MASRGDMKINESAFSFFSLSEEGIKNIYHKFSALSEGKRRERRRLCKKKDETMDLSLCHSTNRHGAWNRVEIDGKFEKSNV